MSISAINKFPTRQATANDRPDWPVRGTKTADVFRTTRRTAKRINNQVESINKKTDGTVYVLCPWRYEVEASQTPTGRPEVIVKKFSLASDALFPVEYGLYRGSPQQAYIYLIGVLEVIESLCISIPSAK